MGDSPVAVSHAASLWTARFRGGITLATIARAMLRRAAIITVLGLLGGCGSSPQRNPDGGDGVLTPPDALAAGRHSFDVTALLGGASNLPPTNGFTLVIDVDAQVAIVGANGGANAVPFTTTDGRTFVVRTPFTVGDKSPDPCGAEESVRYDGIEVTIAADGSLTGRGSGVANISCGDCSFGVAFNATLTGNADRTLPTLRASGTPPSSPFDLFGLRTSEPLPATATARLVADDGAAIDLTPTINDGVIPLIGGFLKPAVILRAGQGYVVTLDGLTDFAGLVDTSGSTLRIVAFPAAPVVPEDGFESATGNALGGAMVMTAGALPAITGSTSLYIGGAGALGLDASNGRSLLVRLARQPGDTKLRLSCRAVTTQAQTSFFGRLQVGSEGASLSAGTSSSFGDATGATEMVDVGGRPAFLTPSTPIEVTLPADVGDEVLLSIAPSNNICFPGGVRPGAGLLIDDLRLE